MYCLVAMADLREAPFSLTYDTLVRAKVLARNERGWSAESPANTDGAKVKWKPLAMGNPKGLPFRGSETGPTQIDVRWETISTPQDGASPVLSYHLEYDNGTLGTKTPTWTTLVGVAPDSLATQYLVTSQLVSGTTYAFRVRARNIFGWGDYSVVDSVTGAGYIKAAREPGIPLAPVTSIDAATGHFAIDWTPPDDRGDPITAYLVEIADAATGNVWTAHNATCDGTIANSEVLKNTFCLIPMAVLTAATPYGYKYTYKDVANSIVGGGDLVQVRVKAANFFKYGELSPVSDASGARIRAVPDKMAAPTEDPSCTDVTLTMNWVALSGVDAGSSAVIAYSLLWDAGDSTK